MSQPQKPPFVPPRHLMRNPFTVHRMASEAITSNTPFLIARFGGTESHIIGQMILQQQLDLDPLRAEQAGNNAGVVPADRRVFRACAVEQLAAGLKTDILAIWDYHFQLDLASFVAPPHLCRLNQFDPVMMWGNKNITPWTLSLSGKRVLVVHPFVDSISDQLERLHTIEVVKDIWPTDVEFELFKPPVTFAGEASDDQSWIDELARAKAAIARVDFDVALIAAGAYGMPLGAFVKDMGRQAFHCGGALQLWFGIMGKRWIEYKIEHIGGTGWVRPKLQDTPRLAQKMERGAYW